MASWERSLLHPTMASHTNDDGRDLSKHFVIGTNISVEFSDGAKPSKRLDVKLNNKRIKASLREKEETDGLAVHRWNLQDEIRIFPDDTLTLRITHGKRYLFTTRVEEAQLSQKDVADEMKGRRQALILLSRQHCTITIEVTSGDIADMDSSVSVKGLDDLLPSHVEEVISSSDSLLENVKNLQSVFDNFPVTDDALKVLEDTIETLGQAHPLAKAVLTALSIPYRFLQNEHVFKKNVKDVAEVMHFTCKCLVDVRYHTKIASAKETFLSIMKTLRDAAIFINNYVSKGKIDQLVAAQFPKKLEKYADDLVTLKNNFQMAMVMQIVRDADQNASMTSDNFLRLRLGPVDPEEQRLGEGCLEGTRVNILQEVRNWLQDFESENILWIVGAPGAGKSTIATSIAKKPSDTVPFSATFFSRRDVQSLRDSRRVWRTLAYGLADKHDGVKSALMQVLSEKKNSDLQYDTVSDQFQKLVKSPLETNSVETRFRSVQKAFPVTIIDALDECHSANDDNWTSLLDSLGYWAKLPRIFKLIVTSRDYRDIDDRLAAVSRRINLTTGDDVSSDSRSDIELFFTKKFAGINSWLKDDFKDLPSDWPGQLVIKKLTDNAAGLFIWADMAVNYIGLRAGGSDPFERLQAVLNDIETRSGIDGADQVDRLYARIVFEAFQHSSAIERARAKSVLAAIVLAKGPLRKGDLIELQSTDTWDARFAIVSTLRMLSPIIPARDVNDALRVCHKTVADFLLSPERSAAAMEYIVQDWNNRGPAAARVSDPRSFVVDNKKENKNLALACLRLLRLNFAKDIDSDDHFLKQPSSSFDYAWDHWLHQQNGQL